MGSPLAPVVPLPRRLDAREGAFVLSRQARIVHRGSEAAASTLQAGIQERTGLWVEITRDEEPGAVLSIEHSAGFGTEGYFLEVTQDRVCLRAETEAGHFYAVQTFIQMIENGHVACTRTEDSPRFAWRGLMLDSARHFQSVDTVKWLLEHMARFKLNVLHWHLTDDQGWRIEIRSRPRLAEVNFGRCADEPGGRGFYSHDDIREVVKYAAERHIRIVPEIEIPAHATAAMAAYPDLTCTGEAVPVTGIGAQTFTRSTGKRIFCASSPRCVEFLEDVLGEVSELFPSDVIHIGGDERPDGIWSACQNCRGLMEQLQNASEEALQHHFMEQASAIVRSLGKRPMAWTATVAHGIPQKQIVQDWFHGVIPAAIQAGAEVVNSRDRYTYFDYPNFPGRQKPSWMPDLPIEKVYQFDPDHEVQSPLILGGECSVWTEHLEEQDLAEAIFPRLLAFAEAVWSPKHLRDLESFRWRVERLEPLVRASFAKPYARPVLEGSVETTMDVEEPFYPEHAFDSRFVRSFWTQSPPRRGDSLTRRFEAPIEAESIRIYTGSDIAPDDVLTDGRVEIDYGRGFEPIGEVQGAFCEVLLDRRPVHALRLVVAEDLPHRLAVREIIISGQEYTTGT